MKKYLFLIGFLISFLFADNVSASENKLYFTSSGNRLYYDSALFDDDTFIHHTDMLPGTTYEDKLVIENKTNNAYPLYLKVRDEARTSLVEEILENVIVEIYLDDKLMYSGFADGLDYVQGGIEIDDVLYLGMFESNTEKNLKVLTTLRPEYSNTKNNVLATVKWDFITMYDDKSTDDDINNNGGSNNSDNNGSNIDNSGNVNSSNSNYGNSSNDNNGLNDKNKSNSRYIHTINPNTGDKLILYAIMLFVFSLIVMIITYFMMNNSKKKINNG